MEAIVLNITKAGFLFLAKKEPLGSGIAVAEGVSTGDRFSSLAIYINNNTNNMPC